MISIDCKKDLLAVSVLLTGLVITLLTFIGIALNGQKVWNEPNPYILYTEITIFGSVLIYVFYDIFFNK